MQFTIGPAEGESAVALPQLLPLGPTGGHRAFAAGEEGRVAHSEVNPFPRPEDAGQDLAHLLLAQFDPFEPIRLDDGAGHPQTRRIDLGTDKLPAVFPASEYGVDQACSGADVQHPPGFGTEVV